MSSQEGGKLEAEVMTAQDSVQLYKVQGVAPPQGDAPAASIDDNARSTLLVTGTLVLLRLPDGDMTDDGPAGHGDMVLAQVTDASGTNSHAWPIAPNLPSLCLSRGVYMFPLDPANNEYYGLYFPPGTDEETIDQFESILDFQSEYRVVADEAMVLQVEKEGTLGSRWEPNLTPPPPPMRFSDYLKVAKQASQDFLAEKRRRKRDYIVDGIRISSGFVSRGIALAAQKGAEQLHKRAASYKETHARTQAPVPVSNATKQRINTAKHLSGTLVKVSTTMVQGAVRVCASVIGFMTKSNKGPGKESATTTVAKAGFGAYVEVFEAMEAAGKLLLSALNVEVTSVAEHKYGPEVAAATSDALEAGSNIVKTGYTVTKLQPGGVAKEAAKVTAKNAINKQ
eukprot:jgi/Mesvir1/1161/Mv17664-RA.1